MENKRKIWVRVAAFMAAIICCVICVIPAYAEEAETAEGQEARLNAMVGADVFRAADHVVDMNYRDYSTYATLASQNVNINWPTTTYQYAMVALDQSGYVYINYTDANGVVGEYGQLVHEVQLNESLGETIIILKDTVFERTLVIKYKREQADGYRISKPYNLYTFDSTVNLEFSSGATWQGYCVLNTAKQDIFYCVSEGLYNPAQMLNFNIGANNEEIYNQGYVAGYQFGFEEGEMHGLEEGLDRGREEGYTEGEADGYRTGYDDGMHQTSLIEGIKDLFRAPMEFVESALNFEIFGIDLGDAVKALVSMMLLALVVTIVWKAVK